MLLACFYIRLARVNNLGKALEISINHGLAALYGIWEPLNTTTKEGFNLILLFKNT
jgi:hypothetical protein